MTTTLIETTRFGTLECSPQDVVDFPDGLLGFPEARRFVVIQHKEGSQYYWLQSVEQGGLAFLVVDPGVCVAEYAPEMPQSVAEALELSEDTPRLVYTIVTIPRGKPEEMTVNLAGPLLINLANRRGKQVVLDTDVYPLKHRVFSVEEKSGEAA